MGGPFDPPPPHLDVRGLSFELRLSYPKFTVNKVNDVAKVLKY